MGFDIYKYADQIGWAADYYEFQTGYIYEISQVEPGSKIPVRDSMTNELIGYAKRTEDE